MASFIFNYHPLVLYLIICIFVLSYYFYLLIFIYICGLACHYFFKRLRRISEAGSGLVHVFLHKQATFTSYVIN